MPTDADADALVEVRDLTTMLSGKAVFDGLSLDIPRGKVTAIMGPSGTGKTTLLKHITGQMRPDRGTLRVDGQNVPTLGREALYALRERIGYLFQNSALLTDYDVFENVAFPLRQHARLPEVLLRNIVLTKLQAVGLRGAARLMPSELSGGMARRVALARAVALDPMLIMYDEPFAGLDPISLGVVGNLIRRLTDTLGLTSILVTHDVHESLKIVDYVYFVSEGAIEAEGTPDQIRASGLPFVHQFVHGEEDGPVPFHYPASSYTQDLGLGARK